MILIQVPVQHVLHGGGVSWTMSFPSPGGGLTGIYREGKIVDPPSQPHTAAGVVFRPGPPARARGAQARRLTVEGLPLLFIDQAVKTRNRLIASTIL
jgi:hypothetical protein